MTAVPVIEQLSEEQASWYASTFDRIVDNVGKAVVGKTGVIRLVVTALLAGGHVLLEDYPGTGKTQLARSLAQTLRATSSRIQFTPDLLPSDVTGVSIYDQEKKTFEFHPGPIFANVVLADEINRASPKTQSALLEVMEEGRVTAEGRTHEVGEPFIVLATQNPIEQAGTYALPEAQLDRFLIKTSVGYPDHDSTVAILTGSAVRDRAGELRAVVTAEVVSEMVRMSSRVHVDAAIADYISRLVTATRTAAGVEVGVSVRGALALVRCAKTWAASQGRGYVLPDDVRELAEPVLGHRMVMEAEAQFDGATAAGALGTVLEEIEPPAHRQLAGDHGRS
ncbi:AAA family ATPase [Georgenia sp. Z1344]|uniref:AAA family ATPase n=1 Tax=Georgenia sp. Z1344 TaxID=3416706 RepID=UPI003CEC1584